MKETIFSAIGIIGAAIAAAFGGWTSAMTTLVIFMGADYITGMAVAVIFKRSPKTESGGAKSDVGWLGLVKKCVIMLFVYIASRLDLIMGTSYLKDAVCIAYIVNELVSLIENAGLMGVPIPDPIMSAIDILKNHKNQKSKS